MIIDVHHHIWRREYETEEYWQKRVTGLIDMAQVLNFQATDEEIKVKYFPQCLDPTGEQAIGEMDKAGIAMKVIVALDHGPDHAGGNVPIEQQNREIAAIARRFPDRFIYFCGVDPRRQGAAGLVGKAIDEWGAKGLKLHPLSGFYPYEKMVYPLIEKVAARKLPVLFHSGALPNYGKRFGWHQGHDWANPTHLDKLVGDFPGVTFIAAHWSYDQWRELIVQAKKHPNLVVDISTHQVTARLDFPEFCRRFREVLDGFGKDRVLFATDSPAIPFMSDKEWVELVKQLPFRASGGVSFTEDEIHRVLHTNGEKLFGFVGKDAASGKRISKAKQV